MLVQGKVHPRRRLGGAGMWLLVGLLLGGAVGAGTMFVLQREKGGIPGGPRLGEAPELDLVPPDAVAFVHVRARDLWKSDLFTGLRKIVEKAGAEQTAFLDQAFVPKPSTFDRATLIVLGSGPPLPAQGDAAAQEPKRPTAPPRPAKGPFVPEPQPERPLFNGPEHIEVVGLLAFTEALDAARVRTSILPDGVSKTVSGKECWQDEKKGLALYFPPDDKTVMALGSVGGIMQLMNRQPKDGKKQGPLTAALELAMKGGRHWFGALNATAINLNLAKLKDEVNLPGLPAGELILLVKDVEAVLKAECYAIGGSIGTDESKIEARLYYKDDAAAEEGEKALRGLAAFGKKKLEEPKRQLLEELKAKPDEKMPRPIDELPKTIGSLVGLGLLNHVDEYLANPPLKRAGREVAAVFDLPSLGETYIAGVAASTALLIPAVAKVREAAARMTDQNHLKQIGLAMHNFHDVNGRFPEATPSKKPNGDKLSWRVQILPFIEEGALYQQFKLDEPWDSPNNKKLIDKMPKLYQSTRALAPPGQTFYKVFSGPGALFEPGKEITMVSVTDGTSNTIMAVEGGAPVIWTKPEDIPFDIKKPLPDLSLNGIKQISVLMADGSVRLINLDTVSEETLKAAITRNAGDQLGPDW